MATTKNIWQSIEQEQQRFNDLGIDEMKDYRKFYLYSLITHSTAIEGSTLTEKANQQLFETGITQGNKQIGEYFMNLDLKDAYEFAISQAAGKTPVTPEFLKELNAATMKSTGGTTSVMAGSFDSSKGEYRLCGVRAGIEGRSYMDYKKVPGKVTELCQYLDTKISGVSTLEEIYNLSFDAHLNLATIHPWVDGNGRTARLLMNYVQFYHNVIPTKIHKADKAKYIYSLYKSQTSGSNIPFREFMAKQHLQTLKEEIKTYIKNNNNTGFSLMF